MNTQAAPFDNPDVRKAVRLLANREQLLVAAQGGRGEARQRPVLAVRPDVQRRPSPSASSIRSRPSRSSSGRASTSSCCTPARSARGSCPRRVAFAQTCKEAGIKCETKVTPADSYWNVVWLKEPFFVSGWANRSFASTYGIALAPKAPQPRDRLERSRRPQDLRPGDAHRRRREAQGAPGRGPAAALGQRRLRHLGLREVHQRRHQERQRLRAEREPPARTT